MATAGNGVFGILCRYVCKSGKRRLPNQQDEGVIRDNASGDRELWTDCVCLGMHFRGTKSMVEKKR